MQQDRGEPVNTTDNGMRLEISKLYNQDMLSDFTITCGDKTFKVHRIILYTQSEYFRKLFGGNFKEANADTLNLPEDDDPCAICVLIRYFYTNELDLTFPRPESHRHKNESAFIISLHAVADKYDVPRLRNLILKHLHNTCHPSNVDDFIDALLVVDGYTSNNAVWDVLMPKIEANLKALLGKERFRDIIREEQAMTFQLLERLASSNAQTGVPDPFLLDPMGNSLPSGFTRSAAPLARGAPASRGVTRGRSGRGGRGMSS